MATISFGSLSTLNYSDSTSHWVNLAGSATLNGNSNASLTNLTVGGIPTGAGMQFTSGSTTYTFTKGSDVYTFTVSLSSGVATISGSRSFGGTVPLSDWQQALQHLQIDATSAYGIANGNYTLTFGGTPTSGNTVTSGTEKFDVTCFYAGTMIRTPDGEVAVESLTPGDLVLTTDGVARKVNWLGRQTVSRRFADPVRVLPIRIKAGALAENVPARDLLVSPDHAMFVDGVLIHAAALLNGTSIVRESNVPQVFTYFHIELDDHSLILAENAPAETFVDNVDRLGFDNWAEFQALYPEGKAVEELPYPRAKAHRQVPVYIRVALADRAQVLGLAIGAGETAAVA